jgi:FMN phosphatase YigB (HAD superfamily)
MIQCLLFDLSEVLIAGLVGVEKELSLALSLPKEEILPCFGGAVFEELLLGNISEDTYLRAVIAIEGWRIDAGRLKAAIRRNFHNQVEGMVPMLMHLALDYELALLSDHALEWISYIRSIHPFLGVFKRTFFSYDLKRLKHDPGAFQAVLEAMSIPPARCLFIDDNPKNVEVAASVGIPGICFLNAEQLAAELDGRLVCSGETGKRWN